VFGYFTAEDGSIQRCLPNRLTTDSLVKRQAPLTLPGGMPFKLCASSDGKRERLVCFASPSPVMNRLPTSVKGTDFENLPMESLQHLEAAFDKAVRNELGGKYIEITVN
jgi:hypothetical protein